MKRPPNQLLFRTVLFRRKQSPKSSTNAASDTSPVSENDIELEASPSTTLPLVKKMPLVPPVISLFQFNSFHTIYKIPNSAFVSYLGITLVLLTIRNFNANFSLRFCFQLFILRFPLFWIAYHLSAWIFINPV